MPHIDNLEEDKSMDISSHQGLASRPKKPLPPREKFTLHVYNRTTDEVHVKKEIVATRVEASAALGNAWNERAASEPNRGWIGKLFDAGGDQIDCIDGDDDDDDDEHTGSAD